MTRLEAIKMLVEHHLEDDTKLGDAARKLQPNVSKMQRLVSVVEQYVAAAVDHSWRGGGDPEDIPTKENALRVARNKFDRVVEEVLFKAET